ncbi:quinone oxidoreductase family protein [Kordiimonas lacus]|uniref:NADPH2:quinone reductase n=1 Tax=Kordiimonas lacus TaxID=637679 RepID=A0A1G6TM08_9PROT|nr:quinone oxidoreductase [Kordiimonas lacus]SDD30091.1 NADPH2:quinone reductase [Kordiimonas lacus]
MVKAIRMEAFGGTDVLKWQDVELGAPGVGEVRIRHTAIGLNFIDTYHRTGLYPLPLPATPGLEAVGVVEAVGDGVGGLAVGDRVGYPIGPIGAYAEARNIPADKIVKIPDSVSDEDAAALMLKGCTVEFLTERLYPVKAGETVLLHAAAGGLGLIACQWLKALGATVIGTVGSEEKAELARANGCTHTVLYREEDFVARVREITNGEGVPVVYDSVGKATFMGSLDCLKRRGVMVTFGNATGPVDPVPPALLAQKGSLFLTRPTLMDYAATRADMVHSTSRVFEMIASGKLKSQINQRFALKDAAKAHEALEARETSGQTILIP